MTIPDTASQDAKLANLAVEFALEYKRADEHLIDTARRLGEAANKLADQSETGSGFYPVDAQIVTDLLSLQNEVITRAGVLHRLLTALGRRNDFEAIVVDPYKFLAD